MKLFLMLGFVAAGLLAQDNAAVMPGHSVPLALENTLRHVNPSSWKLLPETHLQLSGNSAPAGLCSVPLVEMNIPKDQNFTMLQVAPKALLDPKMVAAPPIGACVVDPSPKSPTHPER